MQGPLYFVPPDETLLIVINKKVQTHAVKWHHAGYPPP